MPGYGNVAVAPVRGGGVPGTDMVMRFWARLKVILLLLVAVVDVVMDFDVAFGVVMDDSNVKSARSCCFMASAG